MLTNAAAGDEQGNEDVVQIWHRSNWHWYLKQEQVYTGGQGVRVRWDEVAAQRLHVASGAGWYRQVRCPCCRICVKPVKVVHPVIQPTCMCGPA